MGEKEADPGVVFVSFMRDLAFWREGASKLVSFSFSSLLVFSISFPTFSLATLLNLNGCLFVFSTSGLGLGQPKQSRQIQLCGWPDRAALWGPGLRVYWRQRKDPHEREAR